MAGLVPAIHVFLCSQDVDARHKAGHDDSLIGRTTHWVGAYTGPSYKSFHSGFDALMSRTFHARGQCLIAFSR